MLKKIQLYIIPNLPDFASAAVLTSAGRFNAFYSAFITQEFFVSLTQVLPNIFRMFVTIFIHDTNRSIDNNFL